MAQPKNRSTFEEVPNNADTKSVLNSESDGACYVKLVHRTTPTSTTDSPQRMRVHRQRTAYAE